MEETLDLEEAGLNDLELNEEDLSNTDEEYDGLSEEASKIFRQLLGKSKSLFPDTIHFFSIVVSE